MTMTGKIALEEHVLDPAQAAYFNLLSGGRDPFQAPHARAVLERMEDSDARRLADMDRVGIARAILSYYNGSSVQLDPDAERAVSVSREMNDFLARRIAAHPTRFSGWAALAVQAPDAAAAELERCVTQHGFVGAMINGSTAGAYLDEPQFAPIWETAAALKVPLYLHPGLTTPDPVRSYVTYPALEKPAWGWSVETGLHALRIILGGVFDRYPDMALILGHMGELLPYHCARFDQIEPAIQAEAVKPSKPITHYLRNNIHITTSGNVSPATMTAAIMELGAERILYALDYPLADIDEAAAQVERAIQDSAARDNIFSGNARRLLAL